MTLETAPTRFIEANGIGFSYRELGLKEGTPLVCLQHFTGTMDTWDPAVINALATKRPVIVFNNRGIGGSGGDTPDTVAAMANDAIAFLRALGLTKVHLLGFSLGGMVAQVIAGEEPSLVEKVILAGTAPQGGEQHLMEVLKEAFSDPSVGDPRLPLFFTKSSSSRAAGSLFLQRASVRTMHRDPDSGESIATAQANAIIGWCSIQDPSAHLLRAMTQPALIVCGSDDTMFPDRNSYLMFKQLRNAQLVLYPDAGHGAIFQHHELFVDHADLFLSN